MDKVLKAISRYNMLASGARVAAAVSGGRDSVCLLHVLLELAPRIGFTVAGVAHLNHGLRGEESDADERFVAELAARHGIRFWRERADLTTTDPNLEQAGRRARHAFFERLIREGAVDRVATGHTSSDQAETVLFRLLRGSGLSGLAGILPVTREGLIRPLIGVSREETEAYLRDRGITWREDRSNSDPRFARNRIRRDLLPQLEREWNPDLSGALANLADLAFEEERWRDAETARLGRDLLVHDNRGIEIEVARLASLPRAAARRLLRDATAPQRSMTFAHIERILDLAAQPQGHGRLEVPGVTVLRSLDWIRIAPAEIPVRPSPIPVQVPGRYPWTGGVICFGIGQSPYQDDGCVRLKARAGTHPAPLELRGWKAGDRYRRVGKSRDQKIKELFQEARVPSWRRLNWPIVTSGPKILWTRDFGAASPEEGNAESSDLILRIWEEKPSGAEPKQGYSASVSLGGRTHDF